MTEPTQPWADPALLSGLTGHWQALWQGRRLFQVKVGTGWIRLDLEGPDRPRLLLTNLPGAPLVFNLPNPWPTPVQRALIPVKDSPLVTLLDGACLEGAGFFPHDRVAALRFSRPDGGRLFLLHQLFGAKGNTTLLDDRAVLLWSRHRPPHSLLSTRPPAAVWRSAPLAAAEDLVSPGALEHLTRRLADDLGQTLGRALERQLKAADRLVENLTRDLEQAEQGDWFRRKAEALAANLHTLVQGRSQVELADLRDGSPLVIDLNPARSPAANMEAWFRKARKAEKGREIIRARLVAARRQNDLLKTAHMALSASRQADLTNTDRLAALQAWRHDHRDLLPVTGRHSARRETAAARPFRRYLIEGTWEVWVGRNNQENDKLTHRASHLKDIWFHAQGVSGSHVILRTGGQPDQVPKTILHKAAALAALHSKARHSSLVPVIHTERRFVRKPRKSPAGVAVCLQEKSVFVVPAVPPGVTSC